ncbi:MAG: diacylglycerol kinase family lipid kinase [Oscillospiraceae bacterium]|nr:diacylglycerol kinase family lipid kinase [Oscillospiraceae bacterium]
MKHLFIVNPTAGGKDRTEEVRAAVQAEFAGKEDSFEVYTTTAPLDATDKVRTACASGEEMRIYSCGGDGTFNECVSGAVGAANVAVCPWPLGTGNDFVRMFGQEGDLYRNLSALVNGSVRPIDVIRCNERYSVNICSAGIDARIGVNVHNYSHLPLVGGSFAYIISVVVEAIRGINQKMKITHINGTEENEYALVCVCNGRFYGGGFNPSLNAMPDDGILDVYIIKKVNLLQLVQLIGKYAAGKADELPEFVTHLRTDHITLEFDEETVLQVDGEALHTAKAEMQLAPKALNLIVPQGMKFFDGTL